VTGCSGAVSRLVFSKRKRYSSYKTNAPEKDMKGQLLNKMLVLATNSHADQYDKGGNPYILHPLKVMHYLKTDDVELQCIALGHDIIEDTKVTYADLRDQGFTARII